MGTSELATMSLLPLVARGLGLTAPSSGHLVSAYALGVVIGAPLIAVLGVRAPRRGLLVALTALVALANAASALAPGYAVLLAARFAAGVPHGAYFGLATVVAASVVPAERRTHAVARVMLGIGAAAVVGAPVAAALGGVTSWRWSFAALATLAVASSVAVARLTPSGSAPDGASPLRELSALRRGVVWATLATGAVGFGGLFAVYTYLGSTLRQVTGTSPSVTPWVFAACGSGMVVGNLVVPRYAGQRGAAGGLLGWMAVALALYPWAARSTLAVTVDVFALGMGGALGTVLQVRLIDVSGDAQGLAASLNHVAFNVANAVGPWLGGLAIGAGYGWTSTGWVGCALAALGLGIWVASVKLDARGFELKLR